MFDFILDKHMFLLYYYLYRTDVWREYEKIIFSFYFYIVFGQFFDRQSEHHKSRYGQRKYNNIGISNAEYVKEVLKMNGMNSDRVHPGCFIVVSYKEE